MLTHSLSFFLYTSNSFSLPLDLPLGDMQPLPKRRTVEKSNRSGAQALANMQLQQPAFIHSETDRRNDTQQKYITMGCYILILVQLSIQCKYTHC
uniref:Uncharacterized protein n=1 Tax=Hucho hucho TaxID=62062 RepID=A0A4W5LA59_9TELE